MFDKVLAGQFEVTQFLRRSGRTMKLLKRYFYQDGSCKMCGHEHSLAIALDVTKDKPFNYAKCGSCDYQITFDEAFQESQSDKIH